MAPNKEDELEDSEALLPSHSTTDTASLKTSPSRWKAHYAHIIIELLMALTILFLIFRPTFPVHNYTPQKSSPVPDFPLIKKTFRPEPRYLNESMFETKLQTMRTLHNWIELSADARGYVKISNSTSYSLPEPYHQKVDRVSSHEEPVYMISVFHQLHCLSYLTQYFQNVFDTISLTQEIAHHGTHCFDYLRQSILCSADTSLEGKTDDGPGWGSEHVCRDIDAVRQWANERDVYKWRNGLLPGESVL